MGGEALVESSGLSPSDWISLLDPAQSEGSMAGKHCILLLRFG